jgi:hypothetical protein
VKGSKFPFRRALKTKTSASIDQSPLQSSDSVRLY